MLLTCSMLVALCRCIDHAAVLTDSPKLARWTMTVTHCEEIKAILQLLPVLLTTIVFQVGKLDTQHTL